MTNELVLSEAQNMLEMIAQAAKDPSIDAAKMHSLVDLRIKMMEKQAEINFNIAMNNLQHDLPRIKKGAEIRHNNKLISTYAKYEDIDKIIRPLLNREHMSISFRTEQGADGKTTVTGRLSHKDGHYREAGVPLSLDTGGAKSNVQAAGSTITYGKRYAVGMLLNLITVDGLEDDDDGNGGKKDEFISAEQVASLSAQIAEVKADLSAFLKYVGVKELSEIKQSDLKKVLNAIEAKRRQK